MNYYLLEDARIEQRRLKKFLPVLKIYDTPKQLLADVTQDDGPKIMILDVEIKGVEQAGFKIAKMIRDQDPHAQIIMISHHDQLLPLCLEYHIAVIDFVPKKLGDQQFIQRLGKAINTAQRNLEKIKTLAVTPVKLPNGSHTYKTNLNTIVYIASEKGTHYLEVYTTDSVIKIRSNLRDMPSVHPNLVQIHAAYCINSTYLASYAAKTRIVTLNNGIQLPVSRRFVPALKKVAD